MDTEDTVSSGYSRTHVTDRKLEKLEVLLNNRRITIGEVAEVWAVRSFRTNILNMKRVSERLNLKLPYLKKNIALSFAVDPPQPSSFQFAHKNQILRPLFGFRCVE